MALTKEQKVAQLADIKDKLGKCSSVMFVHYIGLSVSDVSDLRDQLRSSEAEMKVAKKTLMKIAAEELKLPALTDELLNGPVACIFSYGEPMTGAQIAFKYAKDHPQVELIGGMFDGQVLSKEQALEFAKMPTRDQLLGMFVGMIQSPLRNFASMCSSPLSAFARSLEELARLDDPFGQAKKKEATA